MRRTTSYEWMKFVKWFTQRTRLQKPGKYFIEQYVITYVLFPLRVLNTGEVW